MFFIFRKRIVHRGKKTTTFGFSWRSSGTAGAQSLLSPTGWNSYLESSFEKFLTEEGWRKVPEMAGETQNMHAEDVDNIAKES